MVRANTEGNNPVAEVEADCFGWLWQLVSSDLRREHNVEVNKYAQVADEEVLKTVSDGEEDEDELDEDTAEDDAAENDRLDEYWHEDTEDEGKDDGSGQQFCRKVFVLLGLLKAG
jgi:hypothetical protein